MKKGIIIFVTVVLILTLSLSIFVSNPIIACRDNLPEHHLDAIKSQSKGVYSKVIPLVPVFVAVNEFSEGTVNYTIYYFPFGSVGMSYTEGEGYNIEKPLTGA